MYITEDIAVGNQNLKALEAGFLQKSHLALLLENDMPRVCIGSLDAYLSRVL